MKSADRVLSLDVLRGFALLGILFGNLTWFTGFAVLSPDEREAMSSATLDALVSWGIHFLVDGKFYGIFSLLFGAGVAILCARAKSHGEDFRILLLRRFSLMLLVGLAHAVLLWFGDIVSLYAVVGFGLLFFVGSSSRNLLRLSVASFLLPVALSGVWLLFPAGEVGYGPGALLGYFGAGSAGESFQANWAFLTERWFLAMFSGRPFKLLGFFLLGLWAGRHGLALSPQNHQPLFRTLRTWGLGLGIPLNIVLAFLITHIPDRPPTLFGFLRAIVDTIAVPCLSVGYCSALLLLLQQDRWRSRLRFLAIPGRMTFTNYLLQSALGVAVFYGYGLGLWGRLGAVWIVPIAFGIFLLQTGFSFLWLGSFQQGPVEALLRRATYWKGRSRIPSDRAPDLSESS